MFALVFHSVHAALVVAGLLTLAWLLRPARSGQARAVADLRAAAAAGAVVARAERRAAAVLGRPIPAPGVPVVPGRGWLALCALALLAGSAIHGVVSPEHFEEGARFGVFFTVLCLAQTAQAVAVVARPSRGVLAGVAALNLATVTLWAVSRTSGLPFGLAEVETVGVPDVLASAAEVLAVGCVLVALARRVRAVPASPAA